MSGSVVEHRLAKARVASSNLVSCLKSKTSSLDGVLLFCHVMTFRGATKGATSSEQEEKEEKGQS